MQSYTTLYFIRLYWIVIPATCFGPTIGPKHVAGIIIQYNLIKYKVVL